MCEFCPLRNGTCIVCGRLCLPLDSLVVTPVSGASPRVRIRPVRPAGSARDEHQACGGGLRIVRKKLGHN